MPSSPRYLSSFHRYTTSLHSYTARLLHYTTSYIAILRVCSATPRVFVATTRVFVTTRDDSSPSFLHSTLSFYTAPRELLQLPEFCTAPRVFRAHNTKYLKHLILVNRNKYNTVKEKQILGNNGHGYLSLLLRTTQFGFI